MIRDTTIADLFHYRVSVAGGWKRDAATVLIDLCRDGMSDTEIVATLERAATHMSAEGVQEIRSVAAEIGIAIPA